MEQPLPNRDPVGRVQSFPERDKQTQILSKNKICFLIMLCPKHPLLAIYCCPLSGKSCQSRWLRLWRRVPRKTAFPWWKPETVPDALCTFFTSGSLNQNLICNAFWFFFALSENLIFALVAKLVRFTYLKCWPPLLFYHKSKDISFFLFLRYAAEPENFRFVQQTFFCTRYFLQTPLTRFSNKFRSDWTFDYCVEYFFPVGILKFS